MDIETLDEVDFLLKLRRKNKVLVTEKCEFKGFLNDKTQNNCFLEKKIEHFAIYYYILI